MYCTEHALSAATRRQIPIFLTDGLTQATKQALSRALTDHKEPPEGVAPRWLFFCSFALLVHRFFFSPRFVSASTAAPRILGSSFLLPAAPHTSAATPAIPQPPLTSAGRSFPPQVVFAPQSILPRRCSPSAGHSSLGGCFYSAAFSLWGCPSGGGNFSPKKA